MQLRPGIENEFIRRQAPVGDGSCHIVRWAVDDIVAVDGLALEESGVEGAGWIHLVKPSEEGVLGVWEDDLEIRRLFCDGSLRLIAE